VRKRLLYKAQHDFSSKHSTHHTVTEITVDCDRTKERFLKSLSLFLGDLSEVYHTSFSLTLFDGLGYFDVRCLSLI